MEWETFPTQGWKNFILRDGKSRFDLISELSTPSAPEITELWTLMDMLCIYLVPCGMFDLYHYLGRVRRNDFRQ